ncbi:MAG TPA: antibiotic biosynthesis monooxygenase, partial [Labilithrix sp.]|nr:antibiotic biosynthesis monooxygenase [Labilithrix sp.]
PVVFRFRTYDVPIPTSRARARAWYESMLELSAMREWELDSKAEVDAAGARPKGTPPDPTSAQHCYAVIFTNRLASGASESYESTATAMVELARNQPGFLGIESARNADGLGITVSYWESLDAIARWKAHPEHQAAQLRGQRSFYSRYEVRVCSVERGYKFDTNA